MEFLQHRWPDIIIVHPGFQVEEIARAGGFHSARITISEN